MEQEISLVMMKPNEKTNGARIPAEEPRMQSLEDRGNGEEEGNLANKMATVYKKKRSDA